MTAQGGSGTQTRVALATKGHQPLHPRTHPDVLAAGNCSWDPGKTQNPAWDNLWVSSNPNHSTGTIPRWSQSTCNLKISENISCIKSEKGPKPERFGIWDASLYFFLTWQCWEFKGSGKEMGEKRKSKRKMRYKINIFYLPKHEVFRTRTVLELQNCWAGEFSPHFTWGATSTEQQMYKNINIYFLYKYRKV